MRHSLILPALLAAALAAPAPAQRRGGGGPPSSPQEQPQPAAGAERATIMVEPVGMLIATFDADGDGRTSRPELARGVERTFKAVDTAGTGRMGYIEYADWCARFLGNATALPSPFTVDANGDSVITLDELQAALAHLYDRFDQAHDGQVTRAELLTIHDAPGGGTGQRRGGGRRNGGPGRRGGGGRDGQ